MNTAALTSAVDEEMALNRAADYTFRFAAGSAIGNEGGPSPGGKRNDVFRLLVARHDMSPPRPDTRKSRIKAARRERNLLDTLKLYGSHLDANFATHPSSSKELSPCR
jgi:hypothetical protein